MADCFQLFLTQNVSFVDKRLDCNGFKVKRRCFRISKHGTVFQGCKYSKRSDNSLVSYSDSCGSKKFCRIQYFLITNDATKIFAIVEPLKILGTLLSYQPKPTDQQFVSSFERNLYGDFFNCVESTNETLVISFDSVISLCIFIDNALGLTFITEVEDVFEHN